MQVHFALKYNPFAKMTVAFSVLKTMKKVIIMIDTARASGRKFLRGIERYLQANPHWEVCLQPPLYLPSQRFNINSWFRLQDADGLIARDSPHTAGLLNLDIPTIINDTRYETPGASVIYTNSEKTGRLAADYFLGLGFRHFAFCGFEGLAWSDRRLKTYCEVLRKQGFETHNYHDWPGSTPQTETERWSIAEWLKTLPRPVCVFACNDDRGVYVLEACKIVGLKVPEEVAVLGVDNDELTCDLSSPPLSSIELNFERGGFETARLLDERMHRKKTAANVVIEPLDIIARQSTNVLSIDDEQVARALRFIREHYNEPIQVRHVVAATVLSRRDLELKFKNRLRRSIKDEINRLRIDSVKRKLINSGDTIYNIAATLEYTDPQHFSRFFRQVTGISPTEYRRRHKPYA